MDMTQRLNDDRACFAGYQPESSPLPANRTSEEEIVEILKTRHEVLRFILALPGNVSVPNIPLHNLEMK